MNFILLDSIDVDLIKAITDGANWIDNSYDRKVVNPEQLREYSLNYGNHNNRCFDGSVFLYLIENSVKEIGIISSEKNIFSFSIEIELDKAHKISSLIRKKGGATRPHIYKNSRIVVF